MVLFENSKMENIKTCSKFVFLLVLKVQTRTGGTASLQHFKDYQN